MFKRFACSALVGIVVLFTGTAASANIITVNTTLNVADIEAGKAGFTGGVQGTPPFSPAYSVQLSPGDVFDFTIDFGGGQLTINDMNAIWAFSYADIVSDVTGTGSIALLDSSGNPLYTSMTKTDTEGEVHFGQYFGVADFPILPSTVTFGGVRYVGTLDAYVDPDVQVRTYATPALYFVAGSYIVRPVPDAGSSLLLLGAGLASLAAARRRMQK
jgi:hypothetical protein